MTFQAFIATNARWLLAGLVLTFFSSVGQTFFIGFYSAELRGALSLSHGEFGLIYMVATLGSAISLVFLGKSVDIWPVRQMAAVTVAGLCIACFFMANAASVPVLLVTIYLLRLLGQGMMSHIAVTAMGRWYSRERGRAIAVCTLGHQLGDGLLPLVLVGLSSWVSWQKQWYIFASALLLIALPLLLTLLQKDRTPRALVDSDSSDILSWRFAQVLRDWAFYLMCLTVLTPSFIGTSVLFQQVHLREVKAWSAETLASAFICMALANMLVGMLAGMAVDRFSATRGLPFFLLPLSAACFVLSYFHAPAAAYVFMTLLGVSYGISNIVFGAIWAENYGTENLGAIRSIATASMVLGSALSPGVSGLLIDQGVHLDQQLRYMGTFCLWLLLVLLLVSKVLTRRRIGSSIG
ncbi:MAG: MFS transporter [Granulosicoccaceae bacterium]